MAAPTTTVLTSAQENGTAFQPRAAGNALVNFASTLTGILNASTTVTVAMSPTSGGTYVTVGVYGLGTSTVLASSLGDSGGLLVPAGYWIKITLGNTSVLSNTTTSMIVWAL